MADGTHAAETVAATHTEQTPDAGLPRGFTWGAVRAGIKASGSPDLAAVVVAGGGVAAASYTRNTIVAAPITVGREYLARTGGRVSAVLVNAGNANCATGPAGIEACQQTCVATAEAMGCIFDEVFPSSTGIIGVPFPLEKVVAALPALRDAMGATIDHAEAFAAAILTTDTRMKVARAVVDVDATEVRLLGVCKGAGMIAPQLGTPVETSLAPPHATMLVYLFTDLAAEAEDLRSLLAPAVEASFNAISIDGDTSTNDTVLLLASGASGVKCSSGGVVDSRIREAFASAMSLVCRSLALQIVQDGEGVGHVVVLNITGAATEAEANLVARTIANSPLCKTAWSSADPNWGRLLAAAGRSGVPVEADRMTITIGNVPVFAHGTRVENYDKTAAHAEMLEREYTIVIDLGRGEAACRFVTCDLTEEYVRINADYSS